jgi:uncharacterized protein YndB with AHSA1/START domain
MNDDYGTVLSPTEVRFERLLPGPIETVWAYLTDSKKRGEWFASGPMEPWVGGKATLRFKHSDLSPLKAPPPEKFREMDAKGHEWSCTITEWDPPRRLAFTSERSSEVVFELAPHPDPKGDKVLLTLTHRKLASRDDMVGVSGGWHSHLAVLVDKAYGRVPPAFWDLWRSIDGQYDKRIAR